MARFKTKLCSIQLQIQIFLLQSILFCIKLLSYFMFMYLLYNHPTIPIYRIRKYTK